MPREAVSDSEVVLGPGDVLGGRYRLVSRLGRGGFGDVWRAKELLPSGDPFREVALKLLTTVADEAFWAEEARLLASFRHTSLVTIYAAGSMALERPVANLPPVVPYVAMELLVGASLADRVRVQKAVPWRRVLRWTRDVAAALDVIHRASVVHLDLKPANLFLTDTGELKVLDFGIARRAGAEEVRARSLELQRSGTSLAELGTAEFVAEQDAYAATRPITNATTERAVVGTPGFMAPEVFERGELTPATDAYALAATFVVLTTGSLPHAVLGEPAWEDPTAVSAWWADVRQATLSGRLRNLAEDPAGLPPGVVTLLERLLAVDPTQRRVTPGSLFALVDDVWERPFGPPKPLYPGLFPLDGAHEGWLAGRGDDVSRIGQTLTHEPAVVLVGARGTGMTSLALAGLVPFLSKNTMDGRADWKALVIGEDRPETALLNGLRELYPDLVGATPSALFEHLKDGDRGLALVIDPLDEHSATSTKLRSLLEAVLDGRPPGVRLVGVTKEDSSDELLASTLGPRLRPLVHFATAPSPSAATAIALNNATLVGHAVKDSEVIASDVARELRADGRRLRYVALSLRTSWDGGRLDGAHWREAGGVAGLVARHADRVLSGLAPEDRSLAEAIFVRLSSAEGRPVSCDHGGLVRGLASSAWELDMSPASELAPRSRGVHHDQRAVRVEGVIERLAAGRLLLLSGSQIEVGHPALLTEWSFVVSARLASTGRLVFRDALREAAVAWEHAGARADLLWQGNLLHELGTNTPWLAGLLSSKEQEFISASQRRERRTRFTRIALLVALFLVILGAVAIDRAYEARQQEAERRRAEAEREAYVATVVARARHTDDPYLRAAWISEAMVKGSSDAALPLDLLRSAEPLPAAHFLTLTPSSTPVFPWSSRFLVAQMGGSDLFLADLEPTDLLSLPADTPIDADLDALRNEGRLTPRTRLLRPHDEPLSELIPLAYDTAFATRSVAGEVRIFRLRHDGHAGLAAILPGRCMGSIFAAERAPIFACAEAGAVSIFDLAKLAKGDAHAVEHVAVVGTLLGISPDGDHLATVTGQTLRLWQRSTQQAREISANSPVLMARFHPTEPVLAIIEEVTVELVSLHDDSRSAPLDAPDAPTDARWSPGGELLGLCAEGGSTIWMAPFAKDEHDTREPLDPKALESVCAPPSGGPRRLEGPRDVPAWAQNAAELWGGFELRDGRIVSRDLVVFSPRGAGSTSSRFRFQARDMSGGVEAHNADDSVVAVLRDGPDLVVQVAEDVRIYRLKDGQRVQARKGNLLARCADGRLLSWLKAKEVWQVLDVRSGTVVAEIPREPGVVVGVEPSCTLFFTQRLDGSLVAWPLSDPKPSVVTKADGLIYDARPSPARGDVLPGLWLAHSSGAITRVDASGAAFLYGYATPRASVLGDGPEPLDLAFADASGVVVQARNGTVSRYTDASAGGPWTDFSFAKDGQSVLLASRERLAVLDLVHGDIVATSPSQGRGRLSAWDDDGSLLAWSFDYAGGAEGLVIPRGVPFAKSAIDALSNVRVNNGKLELR